LGPKKNWTDFGGGKPGRSVTKKWFGKNLGLWWGK